MDKILAALYFLFILLEVILIFNLLIVVHELGHFLAARWRGLVVEQFAVWFGKPLWKRTYKGVVYSLGSIPFGGFVKLPQMAPMDAIEGESEVPREQLPAVAPLDKIIVAVAGPLFSLGLAFLFAVTVWAVKRPLSQAELSTIIGNVRPDGPAETAKTNAAGVEPGLKPGDRILEVDGHPITRFGGMNSSVTWYVARSEGSTIPIEVERDGRTITFNPKPDVDDQETSWFRRKPLREVAISPAYDSIVGAVQPDSPAAKAGLQKDDVVTAANGQHIYEPLGVSDQETALYNSPIELSVTRHGQPITVTLPAMPFKIGTVLDGSPADKAGLKQGDVLMTINGTAPTKFADLRDLITAHPDEPIHLTVSHKGGEPQKADDVQPLVPKGKTRPIIGITPDFEADGIEWVDGGLTTLKRESPLDQIANSVTTIVNTVGAVFAPKSNIGFQHLGGPLMIGRTYFALLTSPDGWRLALWFSVVLNVNLALLNMLPIPVLDGGHVLLALVEWIRRKPVNIRALEIIQTACFVVIAGYMLYVSFYDVGDFALGRRSRHEVEFSSPPPASNK